MSRTFSSLRKIIYSAKYYFRLLIKKYSRKICQFHSHIDGLIPNKSIAFRFHYIYRHDSHAFALFHSFFLSSYVHRCYFPPNHSPYSDILANRQCRTCWFHGIVVVAVVVVVVAVGNGFFFWLCVSFRFHFLPLCSYIFLQLAHVFWRKVALLERYTFFMSSVHFSLSVCVVCVFFSPKNLFAHQQQQETETEQPNT